MSHDIYSLETGAIEVRLPRNLTPDEVQEIEEWFDLIVRRLKRLSLKPKVQEDEPQAG